MFAIIALVVVLVLFVALTKLGHKLNPVTVNAADFDIHDVRMVKAKHRR